MVVYRALLPCALFAALCALLLPVPLAALQNGLARTPPMGWLSWQRFRCNTDCQYFPNNCINAQLYMDMADRMAADGFKDVGYEYVNIDDCWPEVQRLPNGTLVANLQRFPYGIKAVADYVHSKGLKLGLYTDIGLLTCGGYPGSYGYYELDAQTFASWGVDSLKVDGCYAKSSSYASLYPQMGAALNASGRDIVYYCSWPAYIQGQANFTQIAQYCNGWRAYDDIDDSSDAVFNIASWWAANQDQLVPAAGPGAWNDADMLIPGDFGLSLPVAEYQMAIWAIIASPMLMSNDLRLISKDMSELLRNREIIAVSQDPLGRQGKQLTSLSSVTAQWWVRELAGGDLAVVAASNCSYMGTFFPVTASLSSLGWSLPSAQVRDLLHHSSYTVEENITLTLAPNSVAMVRLSARNASLHPSALWYP